MKTRLDYGKAAPGSVQAMHKLQKYVDESGLEHSLSGVEQSLHLPLSEEVLALLIYGLCGLLFSPLGSHFN
jgi:hypothetical protein